MKNVHYELLYIIPLKYTDQENEAIGKEVDVLIEKYKGSIIKTIALGKRKLAYKINHFHTGYYICTHFNMESKGLMGLNKELLLKTNDNLLRYQIVKTGCELDEEKYKVAFGKKLEETEIKNAVKEPTTKIERKKKKEEKEVSEEEIKEKIDAMISSDDMKDLKV